MGFNVAIDGPAGAGKSTIAKKVAKGIGFVYVDTGAMYRAMALYFIRRRIPAESESEVEKACSGIEVTIGFQDGEQQVCLNGENVNPFIRTEEVGKVASTTSRYQSVRDKLLSLQRDLAKQENVVMDGRDIGTHVLPNANLKIYLTASEQVRAKRRYMELKEKGIESDLRQIEEDIVKRDEQDMNRTIAPLKKAEDAILIDSSNMTINEVVDHIVNLISNIYKGKGTHEG